MENHDGYFHVINYKWKNDGFPELTCYDKWNITMAHGKIHWTSFDSITMFKFAKDVDVDQAGHVAIWFEEVICIQLLTSLHSRCRRESISPCEIRDSGNSWTKIGSTKKEKIRDTIQHELIQEDETIEETSPSNMNHSSKKWASLKTQWTIEKVQDSMKLLLNIWDGEPPSSVTPVARCLQHQLTILAGWLTKMEKISGLRNWGSWEKCGLWKTLGICPGCFFGTKGWNYGNSWHHIRGGDPSAMIFYDFLVKTPPAGIFLVHGCSVQNHHGGLKSGPCGLLVSATPSCVCSSKLDLA